MRYSTLIIPDSVSKDHKYYGYLHTLEEEMLPFYAGIGTKSNESFSRALDEESRTKEWKSKTQNKHYNIEICISSDDYNIIKQWEIDMILKLTKSDIVNKTKGGEGNPGYKHTEETRKKMSESRKGKKLSDMHKFKIRVGHILRKLD